MRQAHGRRMALALAMALVVMGIVLGAVRAASLTTPPTAIGTPQPDE